MSEPVSSLCFFGGPMGIHQNQLVLLIFFIKNHGYVWEPALFEYLRSIGTRHPNWSYWYLRTTDTKMKERELLESSNKKKLSYWDLTSRPAVAASRQAPWPHQHATCFFSSPNQHHPPPPFTWGRRKRRFRAEQAPARSWWSLMIVVVVVRG